MTTARDFITLALKEAGVTGVGQTPLNEDVNDSFTLLNRMLAQWQKKRWLVPSLFEIAAFGNNQKSNLIGPGQYYNAARPDKIQAAYFIQNPSGANAFSISSFTPGTFDTDNGEASNNVSFPLTPIWSWEDYSLIALKNLNSWPQFFFYDAAFPYGNVYIWPIPSSQYEIHLICKSPIGFTTEIEDGQIISGGALYTNGNYTGVPFTNLTGFGNGATFDCTVSGGIITSVTVNDGGNGYKINDQLSVNNTFLGGTGSSFIWQVNDVTDDLDAEFNMPPEYEEAIHYNLVKRICSAYQYDLNPTTDQLAKLALNVIKVANTQVPTLQMPRELRNVRTNNFYIFNADVN